jgi:hypothetical protein
MKPGTHVWPPLFDFQESHFLFEERRYQHLGEDK